MRKSTRIVKRLLALFLVVLMSINTLGAVVSDNDGSAFITKAEFDSLKNNFQSQIDQYNTSIDSKIDGAIAAYLAGINVAKETIYKVESADWEKVLATNYVLPESWQLPDMNLTFNYNYCAPNDDSSWYETWWATSGLVYNRPSTIHQVRNLVSAGVESTTYTLPDTVVWLGQSTDYADKITGVKTGKCDSIYGKTGADRFKYSYLYGATGLQADISVIYPFQFQSGYVKGRSVNSVWNAQLYWSCGDPNYSYNLLPTVESDWVNRDLSTSITLNYVDGKQYKNEHIIEWDNYNHTNLSDPTWTNSLGLNINWTEEEAVTNSQIIKTGKWGVYEMCETTKRNNPVAWENSATRYEYTNPGIIQFQARTADITNFYSGGFGGTRNNNIMSVGVLNKTYTSDKIYQWSGERKLIRDETKSIQNVNLLNGVVIAYAKQNETFKWEPKVTGTYYDTATNTNKPITKWRVKLSKTPFGTGDSVAASSDVLKNKNQTNDYLVTNETTGVCKFEVEVGDDTVIFCKWWPDDTNICDNYNWQGTLDLTQCGTYSIVET
ncbi:MAG: hypothetical protein J6M39_05135 [Lachnospiraceae bacterium]|nr:hypothetical protein [Lachnospiraceae bacterium]